MLLAGCSPPDSPPGYDEQHVPVSSEAFKSYSALFDVDRASMGFPPLPTTGEVRILTVDREHWSLEYPPPHYDVSFQFYEGTTGYPRTSRFAALKRTDEGFQWVSEQVAFSGPTRYVRDESETNECISISAETEEVLHIGAKIQGTVIAYDGPDKRLARRMQHADNLTLTQIGPVLREWGYDFNVDKLQQPAASKGK